MSAGNPLTANYLLIVDPGVGVERRVADIPYATPAEFVGSGPRQDLNLAVAASQLRVHRREDDSEFADHVRVDDCSRTNTAVVPPFLDAETVAHRVDHSGADPRESRGCPETRTPDTGHCLHEIEHVGRYERKIADLVFRQDLSDRWRRLGQ
jgi:hypothetical protein